LRALGVLARSDSSWRSATSANEKSSRGANKEDGDLNRNRNWNWERGGAQLAGVRFLCRKAGDQIKGGAKWPARGSAWGVLRASWGIWARLSALSGDKCPEIGILPPKVAPIALDKQKQTGGSESKCSLALGPPAA